MNEKENQEPTPEEVELSPEILEQVMDKVKDINEFGTAIHAARLILAESKGQKELQQIFTEGLLGWSMSFHAGGPKVSRDREGWLKSARSLRGVVNFNLVGRDIEEARDTYWLHNRGLAIIFDLSDFVEGESVSVSDFRKLTKEGFKNTDFRLQRHKYYPGFQEAALADSPPFDEQGLIRPHPGDGFILSPRVRPSRFEGVIIKNPTPEDESVVLGVARRTYRGKPELLLPVYDQYGNLRWPKQMTYDEVKAFVEERDKKKRK